MDVLHSSSNMDETGLRERNVKQQTSAASEAKETVQELSSEEQHPAQSEKDKKTFGRTLDGTGRYCIQHVVV